MIWLLLWPLDWGVLPLPTHLANIRKWNPALIRWTFEPYAVAIRKATLEEMGALPVIYGSEAKFQELPEIERLRFQLHAPPKTDWSPEKEWRIIGDIDLSLSHIAKRHHRSSFYRRRSLIHSGTWETVVEHLGAL